MAETALIVDPGLTGRYEHVLFDTAPIFAGLAGEGRLYAITARIRAVSSACRAAHRTAS